MRGLARNAPATVAILGTGCRPDARCARPPVLMLHGHGGTAASFDRLIEALIAGGWARGEMRAGSAFLAGLDRAGAPEAVPVVTVASAADRVVAPSGARVPGARHVTLCCPPHHRLLHHGGVLRAVQGALSAPEGKGR